MRYVKRKKSVELENTNGWPTEKQQPQARTLTQHHRQMACWITPALAHWSLSLPLSLTRSLSLLQSHIWLCVSHPSYQKLNHIRPLSQIYGVYFRFRSNAPIPSIVFDCVSLYNNRAYNFTAQYGAKPQTFAIHQTNKLSSIQFSFAVKMHKDTDLFFPPFLALCVSF